MFDELLPTVMVLIGFFVVVLVWWMTLYRGRRRMLAGMAVRLRMRFTAHWHEELAEELAQCYCMQRGHWPRIYNVISGRHSGCQFWYCDFSYETGTGAGRKIHNKSVAVCRSAKELPGIIALRSMDFEPIGRYRFYEPLTLPDWTGPEEYSFYGQQKALGELLALPRLSESLGRSHTDNCELMGRYLILFSDRLNRPGKIARMLLRAVRCAKAMEREEVKK